MKLPLIFTNLEKILNIYEDDFYHFEKNKK